MDALRQFISIMLNERIRGGLKRIQAPDLQLAKNISWNEFKQIESLDDCNKYAKERLQFIGQGSSRNSYVLTSKKVLKIARDEDSIQQNKKEVITNHDEDLNRFFTKVFDNSPDCKWIVSELVNPVKNMQEIENYLGIKRGEFRLMFIMSRSEYGYVQPKDWSRKDKDLMFKRISNDQHDDRLNDFLDFLVLAQQKNIEIYDFPGKDQWGKTVDGRIVLLDYGL